MAGPTTTMNNSSGSNSNTHQTSTPSNEDIPDILSSHPPELSWLHDRPREEFYFGSKWKPSLPSREATTTCSLMTSSQQARQLLSRTDQIRHNRRDLLTQSPHITQDESETLAIYLREMPTLRAPLTQREDEAVVPEVTTHKEGTAVDQAQQILKLTTMASTFEELYPANQLQVRLTLEEADLLNKILDKIEGIDSRLD